MYKVTLPIPENLHDLLSRPILCALTTLSPQGLPHCVPVWCDYDGEYVRFNSPAASKKVRNLETNPNLSLLIIDPENAGHWLEIQGHVGEVRDADHGATKHINKLSEKYTGSPVYQAWGDSAINRRMYVIEAVKVHGN